MNQAFKPPRLSAMDRAFARYSFRIATADDVDGIVALGHEHLAEALYNGVVPDPITYRGWLRQRLEYGMGVWILALDGDEVIGSLSYTLDRSISEQPIADMGLFFVSKRHRRSAVPAILFMLALEQAKEEDGACVFHAAIAETPVGKSLENTCRKAGFVQTGVVMGKVL